MSDRIKALLISFVFMQGNLVGMIARRQLAQIPALLRDMLSIVEQLEPHSVYNVSRHSPYAESYDQLMAKDGALEFRSKFRLNLQAA
ncbi:hypothetical protein GGI24_007188, partial [Coemansia furcata]